MGFVVQYVINLIDSYRMLKNTEHIYTYIIQKNSTLRSNFTNRTSFYTAHLVMAESNELCKNFGNKTIFPTEDC